MLGGDNTFVYFAALHRLPVPLAIYFDFILLVALGPYELSWMETESPHPQLLFLFFLPVSIGFALGTKKIKLYLN